MKKQGWLKKLKMGIIRFIRMGIDFIAHLVRNRYQIYELTKRDFKKAYVQNILGLAWTILDPLAFMLILWFVFSVGMKQGDSMDVPFIAYLITGLVSYNLFSDSLMQATGSIKAYSFLLDQVNFRIAMLPLIKILSNLVVHLLVLLVVIAILLINGIKPSIYWLQVFYYIFVTCIMLTGMSLFSSSVRLFFPDIQNIISIVIRFLFFLTPIFWNLNLLPKKYIPVLKLNPIFYIVNGYRDSFLYNRGFWKDPQWTLYFWALMVIALVMGIIVFKRLEPHFADVV